MCLRRTINLVNFRKNSILHFTAVTYQWYRSSDGDFVRPDLNPRAFISSDGKLYFSEVTQSDATNYTCLVRLTSSGDATLATDQPPSSVSLPIPLQVNFEGISQLHLANKTSTLIFDSV